MISVNYKNALSFFKEYELEYLSGSARYANELLESKKGAGSDFLGWVNLFNHFLKLLKK